jgi:C-methyltransferase
MTVQDVVEETARDLARDAAADAPPVTAEGLLAMMTAYKSTAVLRACAGLRLFDALADGPRDAGQVAAFCGTDPRGTGVLLAAAAGLGLLAGAGDRYALPPGAAELLVSTSPGYRGGIAKVAAGDLEWAALGTLAEAVRGRRPAADLLAPDLPYWSDFAEHTTFVTKALAALVADAVETAGPGSGPAGPVRSVLDVGCGHGLLGYELLRRHRDARLAAQDWPDVLRVAAGHAERQGVADRTVFVPGDAFTADLGGPYDVIVVGNVLFHLSPERAEELLARLAAVLAPGGRLVVAGFTAGDAPASEEMHAALLGLLMLTATPGGRMYSTADYRRMLAEQGLVGIEVFTRPGLAPRAVVGRAAG